MKHVAFPYQLRGRWNTVTADDREHLREMIEQVLFTNPGERVHRPDFGSGLLSLIFSPAGDLMAAASQVAIQTSLQRWLGDRLSIGAVVVTLHDERVEVQIQYQDRQTGDVRVDEFRTTVRGR